MWGPTSRAAGSCPGPRGGARRAVAHDSGDRPAGTGVGRPRTEPARPTSAEPTPATTAERRPSRSPRARTRRPAAAATSRHDRAGPERRRVAAAEDGARRRRQRPLASCDPSSSTDGDRPRCSTRPPTARQPATRRAEPAVVHVRRRAPMAATPAPAIDGLGQQVRAAASATARGRVPPPARTGRRCSRRHPSGHGRAPPAPAAADPVVAHPATNQRRRPRREASRQ